MAATARALNTSRTYNLHAGIARLNERAFPAKRCKLFKGTDDDPKSSSRKALNFPFLSSGIKKACNTESEMKPKNLIKVDGQGELLARLMKYPAEIRKNNRMKAAASASCVLGCENDGPERNN